MDATVLLDSLEKINSSSNASSSSSSTDLQSKMAVLRVCSQWLTDGSDSSIARPLYAALPNLCTTFFGTSGGQLSGILQCQLSRQEQAMWTVFFSPSSSLALRLLRLQGDHTLMYCISTDNLPTSIRQALVSGNISDLAPIYRSRINYIKSQTSLSSQSPTASQTRSAAAVSSRLSRSDSSANFAPGVSGSVDSSLAVNSNPSIMLNMLEYYMFCFAFTGRLVGSEGAYQGNEFSNNRAASGMFATGSVGSRDSTRVHSNSARSSNGKSNVNSLNGVFSLAPCYFELVKTFLAFYVPKKPAAVSEVDSSAFAAANNGDVNTQYRKSSERLSGTALGGTAQPTSNFPVDNKDVFSCPDLDTTSKALLTSEFVFSIFSELWLCPSETPQQIMGGRPLLPFVKTSLAQTRCVLLLTKHLVSLDLRQILPESQTSQYRSELFEYRRDDVYDMAKANAYRSLRSGLFSFLKMGLEHWPQDDTIEFIVEIWITYITPWKAVNQKFSLEWGPFVKDNFVYYTVLLQTFIQRVQSFSFLTSLRPTRESRVPGFMQNSSSSSTTQSSNSSFLPPTVPTQQRSLEVVEKVLNVFSDTNLVHILQILETALSTLDSYGLVPATPHDPIATHSARSAHPLLNPGYSTPLSKSSRILSLSKNVPDVSANADHLYTYQNSGPALRAHIILFDKPVVSYRPVFIRAIEFDLGQTLLQTQASQQQSQQTIAVDNRLNAQKLAITLMGVSDRLDYYSTNDCISSAPATPRMGTTAPVDGPSSTHSRAIRSSGSATRIRNATPHPDIASKQQPDPTTQTALGVIIHLISLVFGGTSSKVASDTTVSFTRTQIDKVEADIARIGRIVDIIVAIWNLDLESDIMAQIDPSITLMRGGSASDGAFGRQGGRGSFSLDEETDLVVVAPGVFSPEVSGDASLHLTRRGREQIKRGLRKCAAVDVPLVESLRAKKMFMSDESPVLVYLIQVIAPIVDELVGVLHSMCPTIPAITSLPFLRGAFSSWKRLLGSCVGILALYIVARIIVAILWFFLFSSTTTQPVAPVIRHRHAPQTDHRQHQNMPHRHQGRKLN
ncbi:hypothetical protein BASA50_007018 [Batrachochytrium salamandrivorans]|uniref:Sphingomyelin phosphodiesterase 4 n=1 Tax=Batrachochytrium salamandrivorans TaxID=1357716 RepID=A0ABQ8F8B6_9FUNG|nr:hypothetical protein BASA50_007018 [Batrachochytrium salamandrivorans]KAH9250476.1 hypothetical protein BASA81_011716 [Batrachochytrium salamandrivorans]KAH9270641.1 hypothetical protein BASA83_007249 [Batrachochytrium salamandrivorans]